MSVKDDYDFQKFVNDNQLLSELKFPKEELEKKSNPVELKKESEIIRKQNNNILNDIINSENNNMFKNYSGYKQVFLSYSVKDILIAIMLFFFFNKFKLYLYVDYLNSNSINDTLKLKICLSNAIEKSDQFLLVDGRHVKIKIDSQTYIRPWCSWENGCFIAFKGINYTNNTFRLGWADISKNQNNINVNMISDMKKVKYINKNGLN
ncbi:hypothetical protein ACYATP_02645 [Lactobacillaceae bacterium Melli_B4]